MILGINKKRFWCISLLAAIVIVGIVLGLYFGLKTDDEERVPETVWHKGAVVANGMGCAEIGTDMFRLNGTVADAAIATLFCEGVLCPQSMGIGGGFYLTIYKRETKKVEVMYAREVAPILATEDMYSQKPNLAAEGGLAIAVPGELKGYWELHKKYGKLKWSTLIEPTIKLCREGHEVSSYLANIMKSREKRLLNEPSLREIYIDPMTNETWPAGSFIKREKLADSLEIIAKEGADALYSKNGTLLPILMKDLKSFGSIITEEDFYGYKVRWDEPIVMDVQGMKAYTLSAPSGGITLNFMLKILDGYGKMNGSNPLSWHRAVEAMKFGYGRRSELGDPKYVEGIESLLNDLTSPQFAEGIRRQIDDLKTYNDSKHYGAKWSLPAQNYGTAHISVLAPNGDAISVTSTINLVFGAFRRSPLTGIILNDEMDDFSIPNTTNSNGIPASPSNFIKPGKAPMSSMCPSILIDSNDNVRALVGAAGGSKITNAVLSIILRHIFFGETLKEALDAPRLHHQLSPMKIQYEHDYEQRFLDYFLTRGHGLQKLIPDSGFAAAIGLSKDENDNISTAWDRRRGGSSSIVDIK